MAPRADSRLIGSRGPSKKVGWTADRPGSWDWAREWLGRTRHNYDKPGRFAQGFVPASLALLTLGRAHDRAMRAVAGGG